MALDTISKEGVLLRDMFLAYRICKVKRYSFILKALGKSTVVS